METHEGYRRIRPSPMSEESRLYSLSTINTSREVEFSSFRGKYEMIVLPKDIHEKVLEEQPNFMYSYIGYEGKDQLTWVQFEFGDIKLAITLDCDEKRHSLKFIVLREDQ